MTPTTEMPKLNLYFCEFGKRIKYNSPKAHEIYFRIMIPKTPIYLDLALGYRIVS